MLLGLLVRDDADRADVALAEPRARRARDKLELDLKGLVALVALVLRDGDPKAFGDLPAIELDLFRHGRVVAPGDGGAVDRRVLDLDHAGRPFCRVTGTSTTPLDSSTLMLT